MLFKKDKLRKDCIISNCKPIMPERRHLKKVAARLCLVAFLFVISAVGFAQTNNVIRITTKHDLLLLAVDNNSKLKQLYYGQAIPAEDNTDAFISHGELSYPAYGNSVSDAALRLTHADGNLTTDLIYKSSSVTKLADNVSLTRIVLRDSYYADEVTICYKAYFDQDMIEQWMELSHQEKGNVTVYDFASADITVKANSYFLTYFAGDW